MNPDEVGLRLLRSNDVPPTNPHNLASRFGLQDTKGNLVSGVPHPDGTFRFDFCLNVKPGKDPEHPVFTGLYASGPLTDRFVYLRGGLSSAVIGSTGLRLGLAPSIGRWFEPPRNRTGPSPQI